MSENDLIRRGDVLAIVGPMQWSNSPIAAVAGVDAYRAVSALPADERVDKLVEALEAYGFACEAGPLENCQHWIELKECLQCRL